MYFSSGIQPLLPSLNAVIDTGIVSMEDLGGGVTDDCTKVNYNRRMCLNLGSLRWLLVASGGLYS